MATLEDYLFVKDTKWLVWGVMGIFVGALIFHAGVVVGSHSRLMQGRGPQGGFNVQFSPIGSLTMPQGFVAGGHGALGTIETVSLPYFTVLSRNGSTLQIVVGSSTQINGAGGGTSALTEGRTVIVIGDPRDAGTDGEIEAKLIRIVDGLPQGGSVIYGSTEQGSMPPMQGSVYIRQ